MCILGVNGSFVSRDLITGFYFSNILLGFFLCNQYFNIRLLLNWLFFYSAYYFVKEICSISGHYFLKQLITFFLLKYDFNSSFEFSFSFYYVRNGTHNFINVLKLYLPAAWRFNIDLRYFIIFNQIIILFFVNYDSEFLDSFVAVLWTYSSFCDVESRCHKWVIFHWTLVTFSCILKLYFIPDHVWLAIL